MKEVNRLSKRQTILEWLHLSGDVLVKAKVPWTRATEDRAVFFFLTIMMMEQSILKQRRDRKRLLRVLFKNPKAIIFFVSCFELLR